MSELDQHLVQKDQSHGDPKNGKGCIVKCEGSKWNDEHGSYRKLGYHAITGNPEKKKIYERDFTVAANQLRLPARIYEVKIGTTDTHLPKDPRKGSSVWNFVNGNYETAYLPFNHNYHHMIPWDTLRGVLTYNEAFAIQLSTYNLNEGRNLIILPENEPYATALGLWTHPDNHKGYTDDLRDILNRAKQKLNPKRGHKVTQENAAKFKTMFENWEDKEFFRIAEAGELNAQAVTIERYKPSSMSQAAAALAR